MSTSRLPIALLLALFPLAAMAGERDDEIELLKAQLAALQARVAELEARASVPAPVDPPVAAAQPEPPQPELLQPTAAAVPATPMAAVETRGGVRVASTDPDFSFALGGRIHFDGYAFDPGIADPESTTEFRRARLTLQGSAWGWDYKLEQDFAADSNLDGLREAWVARDVLDGKVTIGQFKPYRSMEELTSSNEILMMERPFASATGLFTARQFQQGVGYRHSGQRHTAAFSVFNLRSAGTVRNEGYGYAGRATFAPVRGEDATLHFGAWLSHERVRQGSSALLAVANYAGRRGPFLTVASVAGDSGEDLTAAGVEAAGAFGPLFFQGEYVQADFGQAFGVDQQVAAWYLQGSWHLNGGHKPYRGATGVFGSAPVGAAGLWEITARHDRMRNRDIGGREARSWILGLNYYLNPAMRVMLNYTRGESEASGDDTSQYGLRTQFAF